MKYIILALAVLMTGSCTVSKLPTEHLLISSSKNVNVGDFEIKSSDYDFDTPAWSVKNTPCMAGSRKALRL